MIKEKIAIIFFGISYKKSYNHWSNKKFSVNYKKSLQNYKNKFINFYKKNYDIDFFFATYSTIMNPFLLSDIKPKKFHFEEIFIKDRKLSRNNLIKKATQLYSNDNNIKYKFAIITRFDLHFNAKFESSNIDYSKINLVSILEKPYLVDDNLYIVPHNKLIDFYKILCNLRILSHDLKLRIEKISPINFIKNENKKVHNLTFFNIIRNSRHK